MAAAKSSGGGSKSSGGGSSAPAAKPAAPKAAPAPASKPATPAPAAATAQKTLQTNVQRTDPKTGAVQTGRIVERSDGSKVFLVGNTTTPSSGSGASSQQTAQPSGSIYDNLSPSEAISYANLLGEASATTPGVTTDQLNAEKDRLSGIYNPYYDSVRSQLDISEAQQKQEHEKLRAQISDNYDQALTQIKESYNRRGLLFSGQSLNEEAKTGRDKANALTSSDTALQSTLAELQTKRADLTLKQQQEIENQLNTFIKNQTSINEGIGKQNAKSIAANLATTLLSGIGTRLANEKASANAEKATRLDLAKSAEERAISSLFGTYQGQPTLAGINSIISQGRYAMDQEYQPYKIASAKKSLSNSGSGGGSDPYGRYKNITSNIAERYKLPYNTPRAEYDTVLQIINSKPGDGGWGNTADAIRQAGGDPTKYDELLWETFTGTTKKTTYARGGGAATPTINFNDLPK